jgi:uncharacterized protein DUF1573
MHFFQLRLFVVALSVTITGALLVASPRAAEPQAAQAPRAIVPDLIHDFGSVEQGSKVVHQFAIRNAGTASLTLTKVSLSESGMTARMKPAILPGEEAALTIEWDTTKTKGAVVGKAVLEVNDPARPQITLLLKGVVKLPIDFQPYQAIFASVFKGESALRVVQIINNREQPMGIGRLEQQGDHFQARLKTVNPGRVYQLEVTVPATVAPGRYSEAVYLHTDDAKTPRLMIPVNVIVKSDLYANPDAVDFGSVALAQLANNPSAIDLLTQSLVVRTRAGTFAIKSVTSEIPFLSIQRSPDGAGASEAFRIDVGLRQDRLQPGPISGSLKILTDDKQFPELIVPVKGEILK